MTCICTEIDNHEFEHSLELELKTSITLADIVSNSRCVTIHPDWVEESCGMALTINETVSSLEGRLGVYHLWVEQDCCTDHQMHRMLCAYVGKGAVTQRVKIHRDVKWPSREPLYLSFYECSNRIAKYLEQLFLDIYKFHLNTNENNGTKPLQALWDDDRLVHGTEYLEHGELLEKKYPDVFRP